MTLLHDRASGDRSAVIVGLMSGTSLDGISAAVVRFREANGTAIHAELIAFTQRPYAANERARLEAAMHDATAREYCRLHADLGDWLGAAARDAMQAAHMTANDIAAIASHGQTIWHEPGHSTWQIGDAARIAEHTGCAVIADFRARDVAVGGQGAPLVPMADTRLFAHDTHWRALQNIGGIGNVTIVPPRHVGTIQAAETVRAFDTGPGVVIIDGVVRRLFPARAFDRDGEIAQRGVALPAVIDELLRAPFFGGVPPKSTGRELFTSDYIEAFIARCRVAGAQDADVVATATAFTAYTIADQYARFVHEPIRDVLLSGGGAKNPALVQAIRTAFRAMPEGFPLKHTLVESFDSVFFDGEAKEAVAFALLAYLHLSGRSGNLPSATGARAARILGALTPAA